MSGSPVTWHTSGAAKMFLSLLRNVSVWHQWPPSSADNVEPNGGGGFIKSVCVWSNRKSPLWWQVLLWARRRFPNPPPLPHTHTHTQDWYNLKCLQVFHSFSVCLSFKISNLNLNCCLKSFIPSLMELLLKQFKQRDLSSPVVQLLLVDFVVVVVVFADCSLSQTKGFSSCL